MRKTFALFGAAMSAVLLATAAAGDNVLPRPEAAFNGKIGATAAESTPDFPKDVTAPKGAPNIC